MITLTKEIRDLMTPEMALQILKDGNKRFVNNLEINHDLLEQVNLTSEDQNPFAIVLSCIDSRTSAELIFNQGLGEIFSCRIAGNVLNDDIVGSMEFACKIAGVKLIMVLGHTGCGAIKGACDDVEVGKLTQLLNKIKPAVAMEVSTHSNRNSHNMHFVDSVASINVGLVRSQIVKESQIIAEMLEKGAIAIVGGMYDVATGRVDFYEK